MTASSVAVTPSSFYGRAADAVLLGAMAAGAGLMQFAPWPAASLLGLAGFAVLAFLRLDLALTVVVFSAPFHLLMHSYGSLQFSPLELLTLASFAAWLAGRLARRDFRVPRSRFAMPILLLVAAAAISLFVTEHMRESLRVLRTVVVEPLLVYLMLIDTINNRREMLRLMAALAGSGIAVSMVCFYQYFLSGDTITAEGVYRVKAFYGSPNNVGLFLGRLLPLTLCLAGLGNERRHLWGVAALLIGAALVLSYSWGAWLAVGVAVLFAAAVAGRRWLLAALGLLGPVAAGLVLLAGEERIRSHFSLEEGTTFIRLRLWESAWNMMRDHPIFGVGLDNFLYLYREIYVADEAIIDLDLSHPHNIILDFWLSLGALGVVVIVWLLWWFFSLGWQALQSAGRPWERALAIGLLASMVDFVVHGLVDNSFFLPDLAIVFWLSCAIVEVLNRRYGELTWT